MRFAQLRAWQLELCRDARPGTAELVADLLLWGRPDTAGDVRADELDEATIARLSRCSVPTVKRRVRAARELGLIDVSRDLDPSTGWLGHNRYRLVPLGEWRVRYPERWATLRAHLSSVSPGISGDPSKVKPVTGREIDPPPLRDRPCSCDGDGWLWTVELWPVGRTDELRAVDVPTPCPGTVHRRAS